MKSLLAFLLILGALAPLPAAAEEAPPPPPVFNPEGAAPAAPEAPVMDQSAPQLTENDPGAGGPQLTGNDSVDLAAPQISEEAMIRNALDISYQLYHAEDYRAAAQSTSQIMDKYPKRKLYWVRYLRALSLEHDGLLDQAIADYKKVRKDAPRSTYSNAATFRQGLC